MAASRADIDRWIETAKEKGSRFIISVCDTFDYDDYPVYCENTEELMEKHAEVNGKNMQRVNEIIWIDELGQVHENFSL